MYTQNNKKAAFHSHHAQTSNYLAVNLHDTLANLFFIDVYNKLTIKNSINEFTN